MENLVDSIFKEVSGLPEPTLTTKLYDSVRLIIERDDYKINGEYVRTLARKELSYVALMVDRTILTGWSKEEKTIRMKKKVGLHETWEPDEAVLSCIEELTEDSITLQDKLLDNVRVLAEDYLMTISALRKNSRRILEYLEQSKIPVTPEERQERDTEAKGLRDEVNKFTEMTLNIEKVITKMDELVGKRAVEEKAKARKKLSSLETNKARYQKKREENV